MAASLTSSLGVRFGSVLDRWAAALQGDAHASGRAISIPLKSVGNGQVKSLADQKVRVVLTSADIAYAELDLPAGATSHAAGIVANKLPRLSPWPLSDVLYAFWTEPRAGDEDTGHRVIVAMASASVLHRSLEKSWPEASKAASVRFEIEGESGGTLSLMPANGGKPAAKNASTKSLKLFLAALIAACCLGFAFSTLASRVFAAKQLSLAQTETQLRGQLLQMVRQPASAPGRFLYQQQNGSPSRLIVLETLAYALNDQTFLLNVQMDGDQLRFAGQTNDAAELARRLTELGVFEEVRFAAPITQSDDADRVRFEIVARISNAHEALNQYETFLVPNYAQTTPEGEF
ncbi:MAG: PilN domain-containing protein [Pseudomonadota bacterium]